MPTKFNHPCAAGERVPGRESLAAPARRCAFVDLRLDRTGGLGEALAVARAAHPGLR